ncbi:hypothetical protein I4F81_000812 [Pyropia yezoensis]|uniref:Uncharacterized protein n=1 Tax=Pyropia yezoensis TaxID=2788 RepID=A0ACC3BL30_PYRYE|nr:hypothetical protein I4F81_000812 [Neopyropia yezoensis]
MDCKYTTVFDGVAKELSASLLQTVKPGDEAFQVPAPSRCEYCIRHNKPHRLSGTFEQKGDIVCTMGTCELMADFAKCSRCDKLVSRGGLGEDMILLSWTTACTTIWAHFQDYAAWQATALTTNSTT